jgi:hypothetical protein
LSGSPFPGARFEFAPSPRLAAALIGGHIIAALSVLVSMSGPAAFGLAGGLAALGAATAWSRALLRSRASIRALTIEGASVWLEFADGTKCMAKVGARCYVTRAMVAVAVSGPERRALLVTSDMMDPASFRRFRLWALWRRLPVGYGATGFVVPQQLRP